jgi:hypothetical protein
MAADYRRPWAGSTLALVGALWLGACATPAPPDRAVRRAFVDLDSGATGMLERRGAGPWRIARGVLTGARAPTPRSTLRRFLRALEERDYATLRSLAPPDLRSAMSLEALRRQVEGDPQAADDLVTLLRAHQHDPIQVRGTLATMPYDGFEFEMAYSDGAWVVVDPD